MSTVRELKTLHKCFVPNCPNSVAKTKDKMLIHVSRALKRKWCEQVNIVYNPNKIMYCCEDHLDLNEDLDNYYQWKFMNARPRLKPTATLNLENVSSQASILTENESGIVQGPGSSRQSRTETTPSRQANKNVTPSQKRPKVKALPYSDSDTNSVISEREDSEEEAEVKSKKRKAVDHQVPDTKFSWEGDESLPVYGDDEQQSTKERDDQGSLRDDPDHSTTECPETHEGFVCNECQGLIVRFRHVCVQCTDYDLCAACEKGGAHAHHYLLRVPPHRKHEEVVAVVERVRRAVLAALGENAQFFPELPDDVSVKTEVKEEALDVQEVDPLLPATSPTPTETKCEVWSHKSDPPRTSQDTKIIGTKNVMPVNVSVQTQSRPTQQLKPLKKVVTGAPHLPVMVQTLSSQPQVLNPTITNPSMIQTQSPQPQIPKFVIPKPSMVQPPSTQPQISKSAIPNPDPSQPKQLMLTITPEESGSFRLETLGSGTKGADAKAAKRKPEAGPSQAKLSQQPPKKSKPPVIVLKKDQIVCSAGSQSESPVLKMKKPSQGMHPEASVIQIQSVKGSEVTQTKLVNIGAMTQAQTVSKTQANTSAVAPGVSILSQRLLLPRK